MIRVCLVDDQTLVRQGIRSLLALDDGIEVVAEAADGRQAVEVVPQVRPDVVLMDMRMPVMSGLEALQMLSRLNQLPPTIILTTFDDDQLVLAGLKAGAKGYLLKDVTLDQLVGAIRTVAEGGSLVQPAVTQRLLSGLEHMRNEFVSLDRLPPTIILTTFDDDQLVLAGLKAGAKGYLLKDVTLDQLVGAIRTVADGGSLVQPAVTQRLLSGLEHMRNEFVSLDRPDPLTDRETEILRLMASGFSNKEIANSLGVAEGTIKNHVSNILSKLGVRDRTRAVLKAFELQLV